jgi:hypothetical protein
MSYYDQTTQQYPALPQGNGAGPMPAAAPPGYPPTHYAPPAAYAPVPATPPRRGAGFWVGVTAAIAAGVVLALLGGFFIGKGTRMSSGDVQSKITQQSQADQIALQQTLAQQKSVDQTAMDQAVVQARNAGEKDGYSRGYNKGYNDGNTAGYNQGQSAGYSAGQSAGYNSGQTAGYNQGQADGYNSGFNSGLCTANNLIC